MNSVGILNWATARSARREPLGGPHQNKKRRYCVPTFFIKRPDAESKLSRLAF